MNAQQEMLGVGTEVELRCCTSHPVLMQVSSHTSMVTDWERIFSHPSWVTAGFSPPAAASSSSVLIDKPKHPLIEKKMNGEVVRWTKRRSGH